MYKATFPQEDSCIYSLFCVIRTSITDFGVALDCVELGGAAAKVARMYRISNAVNAISTGMSGVTSMPVDVVDAGVAVTLSMALGGNAFCVRGLHIGTMHKQ